MSDPYLGEIRLLSFSRVPKGWALCNGAGLLISQYQALYALIGSLYAQATQTTFFLPDLRGRTPVGAGNGYSCGSAGGAETVALGEASTPAHAHPLQVSASTGVQATTANGWYAAVAPDSAGAANPLYGAPNNLVALSPGQLQPVGAGTPHSNMQPYFPVNYVIATMGMFPPRS